MQRLMWVAVVVLAAVACGGARSTVATGTPGPQETNRCGTVPLTQQELANAPAATDRDENAQAALDGIEVPPIDPEDGWLVLSATDTELALIRELEKPQNNGVTINLDQPLGDRSIVDGSTLPPRPISTSGTRWEPRSGQLTGVGADFRVLVQVGSIEAGGVVTVTEWDEDERRIVWRSVRGVDHRGRWEVEPVADGSRLVLMLAFELSGPFRWLVERITGRIVARHLEATLLGARRMLEYQDR